jgi:hypothetical protein
VRWPPERCRWPPCLGEATASTSTPHAASDHEGRALAEGRTPDKMNPAAFIVEKISHRPGEGEGESHDRRELPAAGLATLSIQSARVPFSP